MVWHASAGDLQELEIPTVGDTDRGILKREDRLWSSATQACRYIEGPIFIVGCEPGGHGIPRNVRGQGLRIRSRACKDSRRTGRRCLERYRDAGHGISIAVEDSDNQGLGEIPVGVGVLQAPRDRPDAIRHARRDVFEHADAQVPTLGCPRWSTVL